MRLVAVVTDFKIQKEALTARKSRMRLPSPTKKIVASSARKPPPTRAEKTEDEFWNTPSNKARTFHLNDNLLMEEAEFGDTSMASLASPVPIPRSGFAAQLDEAQEGSPSPSPPESPTQRVRVPARSPTPTQEPALLPPQAEIHTNEPPPTAESHETQEPPRKSKPHINVETERIVVSVNSFSGLSIFCNEFCV